MRTVGDAMRGTSPTCWARLAALVLTLAVVGSQVGHAADPGSDYRIGPKDVLQVTVWGHADLTRTVVVGADGSFAFPLVGTVSVMGLTESQVERKLWELLDRDYIVNPQVSVVVGEFRSQRVHILGEVARPGAYVLTGGRVTLLDILSQAGGPSPNAGREVTVVRATNAAGPTRPGPGGSEILRRDLTRLLRGDMRENLPLENGDTIYIPKVTSFFVLGEVHSQGAYAFGKETTTLEAITLAGGFTDRAAPANAHILRRRPDGTQETVPVDLSGADPAAREVRLHEGDTLVVPRGNTFFVSGEVKTPGVYQLAPSATAFGALTLAGGLTERAAPEQVKLIRRLPSGAEQTVVLDLSGADSRARDHSLRDGDILLVPAGSTFFVLGEVNKPGAHVATRRMTAFSAVLLAGGFTQRAAASQVKLIRRLPSGGEEARVLDLSRETAEARGHPLQDGDTLLVPGHTAYFYVLGQVKSPGAYQMDEGITALQAVARAGGFTDIAAPNRSKIIRTHVDGRQETIEIQLNDVIKRVRADIPLLANDVVVVAESFF